MSQKDLEQAARAATSDSTVVAIRRVVVDEPRLILQTTAGDSAFEDFTAATFDPVDLATEGLALATEEAIAEATRKAVAGDDSA